MYQHWRGYEKKINALQPRERILLLISAMAVVYLIWDSFFLTPLLTAQKQLNNDVKMQRQQLASLQQEELVLLRSLSSDPDAGQKREIDALEAQLQALSQELSILSAGLIPAEELPQILRDMLGHNAGLTLLGMETLPVEELPLGSEEPEAAHAAAGVFKHTVVMSLKGGYFQVQNYLTALENLPWRFYWEQLQYQVERYPQGIIELRVYTLSSEAGLLGV